MTLPHREYARIRCPTCARAISGVVTDQGLRLIKHLTPRVAGTQTWCAAGETEVTRDANGQWRRERIR